MNTLSEILNEFKKTKKEKNNFLELLITNFNEMYIFAAIGKKSLYIYQILTYIFTKILKLFQILVVAVADKLDNK